MVTTSPEGHQRSLGLLQEGEGTAEVEYCGAGGGPGVGREGGGGGGVAVGTVGLFQGCCVCHVGE